MLATAVGVIAAVGLFIQVSRPGGQADDEVSPGRPTGETIIAAAAARIAEESLGALPSAVVVAAPGERHAERDAVDSATTSPRGFAFVEHEGDMPKARIARGTAGRSGGNGRRTWVNATTAVSDLARQAADAGRDWSFGWIRLAASASRADLERALRGTRAQVVGASGRMIRARLPGDPEQLGAIAALHAVDGIGATPRETKLAAFEGEPIQDAFGRIPVYITLMAEDADGRWRRAVEDLGAVVGGYEPALRVYRANASRGVIEALAEADFVLAVEPIGLVHATHDTAVPAMGADALRAFDTSPGVYRGTVGGSVPIAVMDTGLNINHLDIASHRESICGANFAYNSGWFGPEGPLVEDEDLWIDSDGHGTHVTGTIAGNGFVEQRFAGMAPGVRHIRFAKVLDSYGAGYGDSIRLGMDFLATGSGCSVAGRMSDRVKPLIVNMSLSGSARIFEGRDVGARKLDATVWSHRQLYVVAQANAGISGFSNYGAAKNSLAVGAARDGGALASFSSHGPTADGRLAPNVVGTGVRVHSAQGGGSRGGYRAINGTSMASPAVAGVAALLMDAVPAHKENPALTRARLMASAIRPDPWLEEGAGFPLDNTTGPGPIQARFGMGKVSARTAVLDRDEPDGWRSGSATAELEDGEYAYHDIEVPAGVSRLDLVMTWDEPPADAVASTVLNDLDLWLDRDADCGAEGCGEHASRSRVDNVEWIVVRNPEPGTYRAKVLAHRVYTEAPRAALAWTVIRGASAPTLAVEADRERIQGGGEHELTLTLTADGYVAAGTRLHVDCRSDGEATCNDLVTIVSASVTREDGVSVDPSGERQPLVPLGYVRSYGPINLGGSIPIGEVAVEDRRNVTLRVRVAEDATEEARLHFTASAWNAQAGSVPVVVGSGDVPGIERPANDDFSAPTVIEGEEGSERLDLLLATPESGEPVFDGSRGRPAGSVWYTWTAPSDGPFRFEVPVLPTDYHDGDDIARYDRVQVFRGDRLAALDEVASSLWQAAFFAEAGQTYHVRVASSSRGAAMDLGWAPGGRPANDDFADAIALDGESGSVDGNSAGATLETGESFGGLVATTWYRWTAPDDGGWRFLAGYRPILVLEGGDFGSLRLVGFRPARNRGSCFPAAAGREYRIAVAEWDAMGLGGDYSLRWWVDGACNTGNDSFAHARSTDNVASPELVVEVDDVSTVEPGEPVETGVRTRWWSWEAPADDLYTWRLEDDGEVVPTYPKMRVTLFTGSALQDLQLVAETGPGAPFDFLLDGAAGERYWIAAGLGNGHPGAYELLHASAKLVWGSTPGNDEVAGAVALAGASGSVGGSNAFATSARGERSSILGRSTLWWTYEAPASGWVRFAVEGDGGPWALTVHRDGADGLGGLDMIGSDRWQRSEGEVRFEATAGVRYTIALGVRGGGRGGEFTVRWDESDDPSWLRYAGRLVDGDRDSQGDPVEIRDPGELAMHASGTALYLASGIGLQVFERDQATGGLDPVQLLEPDFDTTLGSLLWDPHRNRLLLHQCSTWQSFGQLGDGPELDVQDEQASDGGPCSFQLLMDGDGSNVYTVNSVVIGHFDVEDGGGLSLVESIDPGSTVLSAVLSNDGERFYAAVPTGLLVFERDRESGQLTRTDYAEDTISAPQGGRVPLAITDDDAYLFAFDQSGEQANLFSLEDPLNPEWLGNLLPFWDAPYGSRYCRFADPRKEAVAVDVFCPGLAFAARWDAEADELAGSDFVSERQSDRFNGLPIPDFDAPEGFAVSPDDRYVYLSTPRHGIVIIARGGPPAEETTGPDLVLAAPSVDNPAPAPGAAFTLSATVRNRGEDESAATTLRVYRSADETISRGDTEVASTAVPAVAASGTSDHTVELTAPNDSGTYYYGACVDEVADEGDAENNCSTAVAVTVAGNGDAGDPDLVVESPSVDDDRLAPGATFTLSATVRNNGDGASASTTLRYYRSTNATITTRDTEVGTDTVPRISASGSSEQSTGLTAPEDPGTYHYGACVDDVAGESDVENNCSEAVTVVVEETEVGAPDLVVRSPAVDEDSPEPGGAFTFSATVANDGDGGAAATTLRYYRSTNATISRGDPEVGTDAVDGLAAAATADESIGLTAPATPGTYHYGACVDAVDDESDTGNNCSGGVAVNVSGDGGTPDLIVESPTASESEVGPGGSFTLGVSVRNRGGGDAPATTLRYYRSTNGTISRGDTEVGTDDLGEIAASATTEESIDLTAPENAGTYYYGGCVDAVDEEPNTGNNCSRSVAVTVVADDDAPDLVVESPSASESDVEPGTTFRLSATVRNAGDADAGATTLRYYRSSDDAISTGDTEVGTNAVASLPASGSTTESIDLIAPEDPGTYYHGACADAVTGESDTDNNCSAAVALVVGGEEDSYCRADDIVQPNDSCDIYDTSHTFDVDADGRGCLRASFTACSSGRINVRQSGLTFVGARQDDNSWDLEEVAPAPPD